MNAIKIRKNFVFNQETVQQLEKLKIKNNQSATKIVQNLIAQSYQIIAQDRRRKLVDEFLQISAELAAKSDGRYKNASIQSIKAEMGARWL